MGPEAGTKEPREKDPQRIGCVRRYPVPVPEVMPPRRTANAQKASCRIGGVAVRHSKEAEHVAISSDSNFSTHLRGYSTRLGVHINHGAENLDKKPVVTRLDR